MAMLCATQRERVDLTPASSLAVGKKLDLDCRRDVRHPIFRSLNVCNAEFFDCISVPYKMNEPGVLYDKGSSLSKRDKARVALGSRSSHFPKKCRQIASN